MFVIMLLVTALCRVATRISGRRENTTVFKVAEILVLIKTFVQLHFRA